MRYELIIFDLDGTLLDTSEGIYNSVRYAERKMGFQPIEDSRLREFVGPPPKEMYAKVYGVDAETAFQAAKYHREYGRSKAVFEAKVYPGVKETLQQIRDENVRLAVATLKSQQIAESVLKNFSLDGYFDLIVGMDARETFTKCKTLQIAMDMLHTNKAVLVGDSEYDWIGAQEASIDFIAALYGFGFREAPTGAVSIKTTSELIGVLRSV